MTTAGAQTTGGADGTDGTGAADRSWTAAVRARLSLGRLLPLGGPEEGAWLAERAAVTVLGEAARQVPEAVPGRWRIGPVAPDAAVGSPALPPPPGALPVGPLRLEAEVAVELTAAGPAPLPAVAERLRTVLLAAAAERLGLPLTEVDLRVTALLDDRPDAPADSRRPTEPSGGGPAPDEPPEPAGPASGPEPGASGPEAGRPETVRLDEPGAAGDGPPAPEAAVALAVPGVARLTTVLGPSVHRAAGHVRIELATAPGHRALDVALAVRGAVGDGLPVTVVVTGVA
ncbi:hypothetical protein NX801_16680 [Streptomyces sp. LP05-1]|uniref:Nucleopolyhedrovirus P10 family protein n=1 Tax=Streptomyces pyxinae TaxID=2970734 RepID=A0ABT2CIM5_9ACTN|nr:hypothetical protein [Streptomyces sp. LP05-1]MCS0637270.1 hypothetical protein [Streptomyces sp. LP05-1]